MKGIGAFVLMATGVLLILGGTGAFVFVDMIMPPFPPPFPSPIIIPFPPIDMPFPLEIGATNVVGASVCGAPLDELELDGDGGGAVDGRKVDGAVGDEDETGECEEVG